MSAVVDAKNPAPPGTRPGTTSTTSQPDVPAWKKLFIDLVNPKFKSFNKPMLLAVIIGFLTTAAFAGLYAGMVSQCTVLTFTGSMYRLMEQQNEGAFGCKVLRKGIITISPVRIDTNNGYATSADDDSCKIEGQPEGNTPEGIWCLPEDWEKVKDKTCESQYDRLYFVAYQQCPEKMATIGATFGYIGIAELVFTVMVLGVLMPAGVLKNENKSLFNEFKKELFGSAGDVKGLGEEIHGFSGM